MTNSASNTVLPTEYIITDISSIPQYGYRQIKTNAFAVSENGPPLNDGTILSTSKEDRHFDLNILAHK